MSKTPKKPSVPAPQFVIFNPPIPGFEARVDPNPQWRDTLYHFQVGQGWRKCEVGK